MVSQADLAYEVFISDPIPTSVTDPIPNGELFSWSPMSTTLIYGENNAVLVDPPLTIEQAQKVGDWVEQSGKHLEHIYITHGHGDHWFGSGPLVERFPGAVVLAGEDSIRLMRQEGSAEFRKERWDNLFPGQIPPTPVLARPVPPQGFLLEGNTLRSVEVGHSDTDGTTVLHVPSIGLVVAGDVVYNGVHAYLSESADGGREKWLHALDAVARLTPRHVVSGHKNKALPDSPATIEETRQYIRDADRLLKEATSQIEFFDAMCSLHSERLNRAVVWLTATTLMDA
ncbi:MBL fold metallo-hydrolase [Nocardia sp. NBC_00565]|uniref:MBL fold metallo-hydrolase n=1 Tax=Nocardia sp. NBC_00565 TaxID=2975993 RepID=UPI002E8150DA|nr:MBL fold metallo-hydrolase [Nocardia sp. NBC_00565]WUC03566.1 MBL fold metallo-hydrolase [Nocardia sp. NBC_00565]